MRAKAAEATDSLIESANEARQTAKSRTRKATPHHQDRRPLGVAGRHQDGQGRQVRRQGHRHQRPQGRQAHRRPPPSGRRPRLDGVARKAARSGAKATATSARKAAKRTRTTAKRAATTTGRTARKAARSTKAATKRAARR